MEICILDPGGAGMPSLVYRYAGYGGYAVRCCVRTPSKQTSANWLTDLYAGAVIVGQRKSGCESSITMQ